MQNLNPPVSGLMVKALPAGALQAELHPRLTSPAPNNPRLDPELTLFIRLKNPSREWTVGKQAFYESAVPPDHAFDTLIPAEPGFRCLSKHVCSSSRAGLCKAAWSKPAAR